MTLLKTIEELEKKIGDMRAAGYDAFVLIKKAKIELNKEVKLYDKSGGVGETKTT